LNMKLKAKKALLEVAVMTMAGVVIAVMIFTQTRDISRGACFAICGTLMMIQAGCVRALGTE